MNVKGENLDHLGIVAGIIDPIGLVELIDEQLGRHSQQRVTTGQAVKAMILNGLGFVSAPLYLYAASFKAKQRSTYSERISQPKCSTILAERHLGHA